MRLKEMIAWLRSKLGKGYAYGATGQVCTQALLNELEARWGSGHNYDKAKKWIGVEVYDCVNLIKDCRRELDGVWVDVSADGLYRLSTRKDLYRAVVGDLLFRVREGKAEHVGVVVTPGRCIEARSTARGVVESVIVDKDWTCAGSNPWLSEQVFSPEVDRMFGKGFITDREHWQGVIDGTIPANPSNIRRLFQNVTK